jgi:hypothetical protein
LPTPSTENKARDRAHPKAVSVLGRFWDRLQWTRQANQIEDRSLIHGQPVDKEPMIEEKRVPLSEHRQEDAILDRREGRLNGSPAPTSKERGDLFTQMERNALSKAVSEVLKRGTNSLTPRQIRSFLAKYQLARALCGPDLARDPDLPSRLADGLAKAVFGDGLAKAVTKKSKSAAAPEGEDGRISIAKVIAEVA